MEKGISIYLGLDNTVEENITLLHTAAKHGVRRVFTSLHIPEANYTKIQKEIQPFLQVARALDMDIISDISPQTLSLLDMSKLDFAAFAKLGITTLRFDYGYSAAQIATYSRNTVNMRIQLNASTITEDLLDNLTHYQADFSRIDALHNFYPRCGTGISERFLVTKTALLQNRGIAVSAFIPSHNRPRSPLKEGLPTLEDQRYLAAGLAARQLAALGLNGLFIGDSLPTESEIKAIANCETNRIDLTIRPFTTDPATLQLLQQTFTPRADEARDAIRSQESRIFIKNNNIIIAPENQIARQKYSITLDNISYNRYMGELQIITHEQPSDLRVNVIGEVISSNQFLVKYINYPKQFSFSLE